MRRGSMLFGLTISAGCADPCVETDGSGLTTLNDWHVNAGADVDLYGAASDGGVTLVVGEEGTILQSSDGGESWSPATSGVEVALFAVDRSANRSWAAGDGGTLLVNPGSAWGPAEGVATTRALYAVSAAGEVVAVVGDQASWVTIDGGTRWAEIPVASTLRGVHARGEAAIYAVGDGGLFAKLAEGAWVPHPTGTEAALHAVNFASDEQGVAVGAGGVAIYTADGGETWVPASNPPTGDLYGLTSVGQNFLAVGDGGTVWRSSNGGDSWSSLYESGAVRLTDIVTFEDGTMLGTQFLASGFGGDVVVYGSRFVEDTGNEPAGDGCAE